MRSGEWASDISCLLCPHLDAWEVADRFSRWQGGKHVRLSFSFKMIYVFDGILS